MRIVVTGAASAAGAVGSTIVPAVAARGHSVSTADRIEFMSSDADRIIVGEP